MKKLRRSLQHSNTLLTLTQMVFAVGQTLAQALLSQRVLSSKEDSYTGAMKVITTIRVQHPRQECWSKTFRARLSHLESK